MAAKGPGTARLSAAGSRQTLSELAYDRCEELIVTCALRPGQHLSLQELQQATGLGRTPLHLAVSRLAADTLMVVRPRHGLQVAPIDLARERTLLGLRRDMERFVLRLAAERAQPSHRNQLLHIAGVLREKAGNARTGRGRAGRLGIAEFNQLDLRIDRLLAAAAGEPFLEHTLRPLHTIFRRIGWVYHTAVRPGEGVGRTVECHLAMLDAVAARSAEDAVAAADRLIQFVDSMFDAMERGIDPALLDCTLEPLAAAG